MIFLEQMTKATEPFIIELYEASFPESERKPFSMILDFRKKGKADLWVVHDKETKKPIGMAFMLVQKDMVLFDYFAVLKEYQDMGYGSQVLMEVEKLYKGFCIFGEVEPVDETAENLAQRKRRMAFYLRNGLKQTGIHILLFGVEFELMYLGDRPIDYPAYYRFQGKMFGPFKKRFLKKNVKLVC